MGAKKSVQERETLTGIIKDFLVETPVSNAETETLESQYSETVSASPVPALEPSTSTSTLSGNVESIEPTSSSIEDTNGAETEDLTEMGKFHSSIRRLWSIA